MDGRTAPRTAAMDTFWRGSGCGGGGGDVVMRMGTQQQQDLSVRYRNSRPEHATELRVWQDLLWDWAHNVESAFYQR